MPEAAPNEQPSAGHYVISPDYFHTTQIPLVEGREFMSADHAGTPPVAIVNEAFARKYFPKANPLGRHIKIRHGQRASSWSEIVGVSADVKEFSGQVAPRPHLFEPLLQEPPDTMKIIVRTRGEPTAFSDSLRRSVFAVDKDQAITLLGTMNKVIQDSGQGDDIMAELMGSFAGLALVIAAVGVYGLLAYLVGRRTQEFGVRVALGARRSQILSLVMRGAMVLITTGAVIGFLISLTLPRLFAAMFTGFHVNSGLILIGAPTIVMLVALAACYVPARKATKLDPIIALRYE
jgi:putative ABC transport system permease protein